MTCNCDNDGSNEYIIELGEFGLPGAKGDRGEQGYSPVVSYTTNSDTIQFTLVNENSTLTTPNYYDYLAKKDLSNSPIYTILSNYPTNSQVASTYLKVDGSNATNPITLNNFKIQSVGTGTRVGSEGQLTLYGSTTRPAYLQTGSTSKSLALLSDVPTVTNKLETDGSNATSNIAINGITFRNQSNYNNIIKAKNGLDLELSNGGSIVDNNRATIYLITNGNAQISSDNNINLSAVNDIHLNTTNGKVYYGTLTDASKEIATVGDIKNSTITFTQGGIVKGSFTLNQSANAIIALDAGGGGVTGNQISLITEDGTRGITLGINNTTKEAFMTYDIIGGTSFDLNLISGKITPITLTKNSDGTYSVGLDYDNDTLKVNQNGKLYADIEAPTYTAGTGIDINNEEISVDSDYIEAHKAYLADGDSLTDPQGLQDVKYYNESSFDLSKFTVVGSPTITDDGIASGFSSSNYVKVTGLTTTQANKLEFKGSFTYNVASAQQQIFTFNGTESTRIIMTSAGTLRLYCTNANISFTSEELNLNPGDTVNIYASLDATNSTNNIIFKVNGITKQMSKSLTISDITFLTFGGASGYQPFTAGSIDLKQLSITVDGVEVFSGNKTGIDTIKPDDYTVVGTPTISTDGIVTNYDRSNVVRGYNILNLLNKSWKIKTVFRYDNPTIANPLFAFTDYISSGGVGINNDKALSFNGKFGEVNTEIPNVIRFAYSETNFVVGNLYEVALEFDILTGKYTLSYKGLDDNLSGSKSYTPTSTDKQIRAIYLQTDYLLNICGGTIGWVGNACSIDLNAFKIYVNGNLVYQPCLKIPYTLSKTGSKVINAIYRDRVNDMVEQYGYAPYYTLDETNGNFTLPMGEIYGYITRLEGMVKDLQTRLSALESNINAGGASEPVQRNLLGMSPLSLGRPQLLGELNPEDEMNTMDIEPIEDDIREEELEPQETEEEPIEETVEEQEEPQTIENEVVQEEAEETEEGGQDE